MEQGYRRALIINIKDFANESDKVRKKLEDREGSVVDVKNLETLWHKLGFDVETEKNLPAWKIREVVLNTANEINQRHDSSCFVCCIMSHGDMGRIYGSDCKPVDIKEITDSFTKVNCPGLAEKPKLFFIHVIASEETPDTAVSSETAEETPETETETHTREALDAKRLAKDASYERKNDITFRQRTEPKERDFLLGYSTAPGKQCPLFSISPGNQPERIGTGDF